jgi:hypothetical protein
MGLEPIRSVQLRDPLLGISLQDGTGIHGGTTEEEAADPTKEDQAEEVMEVQEAELGEVETEEEEEAEAVKED